MKDKILGIVFCASVSIPAWFLGKLLPVVGAPVFGIVIGMLLAACIGRRRQLEGGIAFTSKKMLQYAVIMLGFGMSFKDILRSGKESLPVIVSTITVSLIIAFFMYKLLKTGKNTSILIGVGSSICGGSAIAASSQAIEACDEEIAQAVSVVFLFNVLAALVFPPLGSALGMSDYGFGIFAGTAVNDTSSVTAAASAWDGIHGGNTLELAAIVKLTRTLAIIPITMTLAFIHGKHKTEDESLQSGKKTVSVFAIFPMFIVFFLLAAVITTFFSIDRSIIGAVRTVSKFFIVMAMTAIGMNTNIVKLIKTGGKPILLGFCCCAAIALTSIAMQKMFGLF